jgi:threonine dehydratase
MVNFTEIELAKQTIKQWIATTPLIKSNELSEQFHCEVFLKLEQLQYTGSFKVRGVFNSLLNLNETERKKGVITASSGNHGVALAYAGMKLQTPVIVVMPKNTPSIKKRLAAKYGAKLYSHGKNYQEALQFARLLQKKTGFKFIHSYEDDSVIVGHGTLGLEIVEQLPDCELIITGVGGGALFAGIAIAVKHANENIKLVAVQPKLVQTIRKSIQKGSPVKVPVGRTTIADGLATGKLGETSFEIIRRYMDIYTVVTEKEITKSIINLLINHKLVAEGAGASTIAALSKLQRNVIENKKIVCVISGGNIDPFQLSNIIKNKNLH